MNYITEISMNNRIYLRAFEPEDYKTIVKWRNDREIAKKLGGGISYFSAAREKKWVEDTIFQCCDVKLAICLCDTNAHIGNVYLTGINYINRTAESHILIGDKTCWGHGYGLEALRQILLFAFNEKGLNRIEAHINADNLASLRLHEKCGYVREGILRKAIFKNGVFKDVIVMSIFKEELIE